MEAKRIVQMSLLRKHLKTDLRKKQINLDDLDDSAIHHKAGLSILGNAVTINQLRKLRTTLKT